MGRNRMQNIGANARTAAGGRQWSEGDSARSYPRRWRLGRRSGLALAVAACAIAGTASAEPVVDRPVASFSRVDVVLAGRISARCDLAGGGDIDLGELTGGQVVRARVALDCNTPFDLSFQSARGGLAHAELPNGQGPFSGTLPYTLDVQVPVAGPRRSVLQAQYDSRSLLARKTLGSGDAIASGGAQIQIRTGSPAGAGLLAGQYAETLSITVASRL